MPSLIFLAGPLAGRRVEVHAEVVVGRDEGVGLVVDDPEISRRHATLRPSGDAVEIEDLGSLNGTYVNGGRIATRVLLTPGDVVRTK
jgi:pSer/pThr/pTyr-binding forkhead associated (FHA) protein